MRLASLTLLLLSLGLAAPAVAQDPVPDTTSAWRYFPLAVGNVWEYYNAGATPNRYTRISVERDSLIDGERYFVRQRTEYFHDFTVLNTDEVVLRFDTTAANVVWPDGTAWFPCRLDTSFPGGEPIACDSANWVVGIGPAEEVTIGTDVVVTAVKAFDGVLGGPALAAGIGYIGHYVCELCVGSSLRYARVGGTEYGEPIVLAGEPSAPQASTLATAVFPNPSFGSVTLELAAPMPQAVTVVVFDALGRRVYAEARAVSGTARLRLDGSLWAPGVYVVRVTGAEGQFTTTRIVKR